MKAKQKKKKLILISVLIIFAFLMLLLFRGRISSYLEEQRTVTVYLVRHGQTEANTEMRHVGGGSDSPLTDTGKSESLKLGEYLQDIHFTNAYSSTLGRAVTTETLVLSKNKFWHDEKKEIIKLSDLRDIEFGKAENLSSDEVAAQFGDAASDFGDQDDKDFKPVTGGESKYEFIQRFDKAISEIVNTKDNYGKTVIVTAHSSASFWLRKKFPEIGDGGLANDSYTIFSYNGKEYKLIEFDKLVD